MLAVRVIPVLLIKNRGLVKTIKFDKPKYIGDPINAVKIFNDKEVDEIVVLDIDASKKNIKPDFELVATIASECFMPLAYGGGVSSLDDMARLYDIGVEKVILNTRAISNLDLVHEASSHFGAQSVVVCIDIKKGEIATVILNHLFKHTQLQVSFGIILYISSICLGLLIKFSAIIFTNLHKLFVFVCLHFLLHLFL